MTGSIKQNKTKLNNSLNDIFLKNTALDFGTINTELLKNKLVCNKSTIYRQLNKMVDIGSLNAFFCNSIQYWEKNSNVHPHLFCNMCKEVLCLESINLNLEDILINSISLNGVCNQCK
ncbi:MAG: transcriptional repressor [Patescibacteria group bacterium]